MQTGRATHLSGPAAFKAVLAQPAAAKTASFVLHALLQPPADLKAQPELAVGVLVPKRFAKRAVTRNTVRRLLYVWFEAFRHHLGRAEGWFVLRLRAPLVTTASATSRQLRRLIRAELEQLRQRSQLRFTSVQA